MYEPVFWTKKEKIREWIHSGINAVIFLLHKPVGQGTQKNVLRVADPRVATFFAEVERPHPFKVGMDSCNVPGAIRFCRNILPESLDTCEGGRVQNSISNAVQYLVVNTGFSFNTRKYNDAIEINQDTSKRVYLALAIALEYSQAFEHLPPSYTSACVGSSKKKDG